MPVTTSSSPSTTPLVERLARSEPEFGSEKPWHHTTSPRRIGGRCSAFCSSEPDAMIVGPPWLLPTKVQLLLSVNGDRPGELRVPDHLLDVGETPATVGAWPVDARPSSLVGRALARRDRSRASAAPSVGAPGREVLAQPGASLVLELSPSVVNSRSMGPPGRRRRNWATGRPCSGAGYQELTGRQIAERRPAGRELRSEAERALPSTSGSSLAWAMPARLSRGASNWAVATASSAARCAVPG